MSGIPHENAPEFAIAATFLRDSGFSVCSPVETSHWLGYNLSHSDYLRFDAHRVLEADLVVVLDGWENSKGALAEIHIALSIGTPVSTLRGEHDITLGQLAAAMWLKNNKSEALP
jgi:hypothetical protein